MLFSNPFFVIYLILITISVGWNVWMDGSPLPPDQTKYNGNRALLSAALQVVIVVSAIVWAITH